MKTRQIHTCSACGATAPRWQGQCPECGAWNTLQAAEVQRTAGRTRTAPEPGTVRPMRLEDMAPEESQGSPTHIPGLDDLLGGGLVPGSAVLLGGEPGIGKSTLLLQMAGKQAEAGRNTVYVSAEESAGQLRSRAERLGILGHGLNALATTNADHAVALLLEPEPPDLLIVDSVQTMASSAVEGLPGQVSQVRAVAAELVETVKRTRAALVLVGHVTKDGQIAGPKLLEHMVDTVLYLEGDRRRFSRILRVLKNRYGPTDELLVLTMTGAGLEVVTDPATFFLGERDASLSGAALAMALDGQRPFAVEVQALAAKSFLPVPRRTALGLDSSRLHLLLAVLEKRLGVGLSSWDVHVKVSGGLSLKDPGLDLGVAAAVLSSLYDKPLPADAAFWGEVDLNGRIRPAPGQEIRKKQAARLGYAPCFEPETCPTLQDMVRTLFGK